MKTVIRKWGNSLALRIPRALAEQAQVHLGGAVDVVGGPGFITVKPAMDHPKLKDLLSKIKPENLHGETDTGLAVGREVW